LKKYCDCFNIGVTCSSSCKCDECRNTGDDSNDSKKRFARSNRRATRLTEKEKDSGTLKAQDPKAEKLACGLASSSSKAFMMLHTPVRKYNPDEDSFAIEHEEARLILERAEACALEWGGESSLLSLSGTEALDAQMEAV